MAGLRFRPRLIPTLATLLTFPVLLALGFWQLDRAEQKMASADAFAVAAERPALDLNRRSPDPDEDMYRRAVARGRPDGERQLVLDNQVYRQVAGYHVLTPIWLRDRDALILLDRGWVPAGESRAALPEAPVSDLPEALSGYLDEGPATGIRLGGMADGESGWPLRIQYIDYAAIGERLGEELIPMVLRLDPDSPGGFVRDWRPEAPTGFGPERHQGYAVQWFGLATALVIIYLVVNLRRERQ